jgi:hypothetical protein
MNQKSIHIGIKPLFLIFIIGSISYLVSSCDRCEGEEYLIAQDWVAYEEGQSFTFQQINGSGTRTGFIDSVETGSYPLDYCDYEYHSFEEFRLYIVGGDVHFFKLNYQYERSMGDNNRCHVTDQSPMQNNMIVHGQTYTDVYISNVADTVQLNDDRIMQFWYSPTSGIVKYVLKSGEEWGLLP